ADATHPYVAGISIVGINGAMFTSSKSVLFVDDNAYIRHALYQLFAVERDFRVCGEAQNGKEAHSKRIAARFDCYGSLHASDERSGSGTRTQAPHPQHNSHLVQRLQQRVHATRGTRHRSAGALRAGFELSSR